MHIDFIGPTGKATCRGNKYIVTATDAFSKSAFAVPLQVITTQSLIKFVEDKILTSHGCPKLIISNRGSQFTSQQWKEFLDQKGIKQHLTTPYHPQSNGIDERFNGTIVKMLKMYVDETQSDWDIKLKYVLYLCNTSIHESTGYCPYQILYGFDPKSPLKPKSTYIYDINKVDSIRNKIRTGARINIERSQQIQQKYYNLKHDEFDLQIGDLVLIKIHALQPDLVKKFHPKWNGPYPIIRIVEEKGVKRAVQVLDIDNNCTKIVALQNIESHHSRKPIEKSQDNSSHEMSKDNNLVDYNHCSYYMQLPENNQSESDNATTNYRDPEIVQQTDMLDVTCNPEPVTSSPRRVTISNDIRLHEYYDDYNDTHEDMSIESNYEENHSVTDNRVNDNEDTSSDMSLEDDKIDNPPTETVNNHTNYVDDYQIDDTINDPDFQASAIEVPT